MFYGTSKVYKLRIGEELKKLTVRSIISNIRTAICDMAKYLYTLLTPLAKSQYNIHKTGDFI